MYIEDRIKDLELKLHLFLKSAPWIPELKGIYKKIRAIGDDIQHIKVTIVANEKNFEGDVFNALKKLERRKRIYRVIRNEKV